MKTPRFWQQRNWASWMLTPLSLLYQLGAWIDRRRTTPIHAAIPIISIGNATAGGTGKTPTVLALIPLLRELGATPHILTRGYQSVPHDAPYLANATDNWRSIGDEAMLLSRIASTWVGRDRLASADAAASDGATLAICDDAHQHHRLYKNLSFLVVDGPYGIGNGQLIPAGPLREPWHTALARTDAIILIGDDAQQLTAPSGKPVFTAALTPSSDISYLAEHPWFAFAGIGRPEKFYQSLRASGATLAATRDFPDHHAYSDADIAALMADAERLGARLITTEKDWVKLIPAAQSQITTLPVALTFTDIPALLEFLRQHIKPA